MLNVLCCHGIKTEKTALNARFKKIWSVCQVWIMSIVYNFAMDGVKMLASLVLIEYELSAGGASPAIHPRRTGLGLPASE
jgi:hypothetical protein